MRLSLNQKYIIGLKELKMTQSDLGKVYLWEMCQKVSNKNVIIQSENITFFHFIITVMITFLNYI